MTGLQNDGLDSEAGDRACFEFETMAAANFDNYLAALAGYAQFCENTIAEYATAEQAAKEAIGSQNLQQMQ